MSAIRDCMEEAFLEGSSDNLSRFMSTASEN